MKRRPITDDEVRAEAMTRLIEVIARLPVGVAPPEYVIREARRLNGEQVNRPAEQENKR